MAGCWVTSCWVAIIPSTKFVLCVAIELILGTVWDAFLLSMGIWQGLEAFRRSLVFLFLIFFVDRLMLLH